MLQWRVQFSAVSSNFVVLGDIRGCLMTFYTSLDLIHSLRTWCASESFSGTRGLSKLVGKIVNEVWIIWTLHRPNFLPIAWFNIRVITLVHVQRFLMLFNLFVVVYLQSCHTLKTNINLFYWSLSCASHR